VLFRPFLTAGQPIPLLRDVRQNMPCELGAPFLTRYRLCQGIQCRDPRFAVRAAGFDKAIDVPLHKYNVVGIISVGEA
jgi:hypothetical protein